MAACQPVAPPIAFSSLPYRFITDSRDLDTNKRLDDLNDAYRLFRCRTIMNCADVCPKGLNPALAISEIRNLLVKRAV